MKIIIDIDTEVPNSKVFAHFKEICIDSFQNFTIQIEGTSFKHTERRAE